MTRELADDLPLFTYEPLASGHVRLLQPADDEDGLTWTMSTVNLDDVPEFDALSYVWGPQDQTFPIKCNGQRHYVHHNLFTALPYLARRNTYKSPWTRVCKADSSDGSVSGNEDYWISSHEGDVEVENDIGRIRLAEDEHRTTAGYDDKDSSPSSSRLDEEFEEACFGTSRDWDCAQTLSMDPHNMEPSRPIWIDALCINQANKEEKISQISSMNQIYRQAKTVWIWLGLAKHQEWVQDAISLLPVLASAVSYTWTQSRDSDQETTQERLLIRTLEESDDKLRQALAHIVCNEWFCRVWTLQEYVLARSAIFLCGWHLIDENLITNAIEEVWNLHASTHSMLDSMVGSTDHSSSALHLKLLVRATIEEPHLSRDSEKNALAKMLLELAEETSLYRDCSLAQDRIFGILGTLTPTTCSSLGLDLFEAAHTAELYTKFSAAVLPLALRDGLSNRNFWQWLNYATNKKQIVDLPSWVPDLHHSFTSKADFGLGYQASSRQSSAMNGQRMGEFIIRGRVIHTIAAACSILPGLFDHELVGLFLELARWEKHIHKACTGLEDYERWMKTLRQGVCQQEILYWQTLVSHKHEDLSEPNLHKAYKLFCIALHSFHRNYHKIMASSVRAYAGPWTKMVRMRVVKAYQRLQTYFSDNKSFLWTMLMALKDRQLYRAHNGAFGSAGRPIRPGDKVCIFNGAPTPHVIRQVLGRPKGTYRLVANAYVANFMKGEVDKMNIQDQDILLV